MSSTKAKLGSQKCKGPVAKKREVLAAKAAVVAKKDNDGHTRVHSGNVVWRSTCGAYADKKRHGMQTVQQWEQEHCVDLPIGGEQVQYSTAPSI